MYYRFSWHSYKCNSWCRKRIHDNCVCSDFYIVGNLYRTYYFCSYSNIDIVTNRRTGTIMRLALIAYAVISMQLAILSYARTVANYDTAIMMYQKPFIKSININFNTYFYTDSTFFSHCN